MAIDFSLPPDIIELRDKVRGFIEKEALQDCVRTRPLQTLRSSLYVRAYLAPDELQRRLACFPDVECVEIPGAGHMVHFDEPDRLNVAIDAFLRRRLGA